jgi:hypothetical protein
MKIMAAWNLHHGVSLGILEQLMGSATVFGTVMTQVQLGSNWLGLGLIALWMLSPIGSQSTTSVLTFVHSNITSNVAVLYFDTRQASIFTTSDNPEAFQTPLDALYLASLVSSESAKNASMDLWGNLKIPAYKQLLANLPAASSGWISVPSGDVPYSSLIGIPTINVSKTGNTTFAVESTYLDLDCYNVSRSAAPVLIEGADSKFNKTFWSTSGLPISFSVALDGFVLEDDNSTTYGPWNGSIGNIPSDTDVSGFGHTLLFQSRIYQDNLGNNGNSTTIAFCTLTQQYVESAVVCSGSFCRVTSMRQSLRSHVSSNITTLSFPRFFLLFSLWFPFATTMQGAGVPSINSTATECYIANPASPFCPAAANSGGFGVVDLSTVPKDIFELRLGQLLNTYYQAALEPFGISGSFAATPADNLTASGILSHLEEQYVVHWPYLGIYVFCSFALLVVAVVGAWFDFQTPGPDFLGYCSSLARDSGFVRTPRGGSALDGVERARLLRDVRVKLGDVGGGSDDGVGRIAFADEDRARVVRPKAFYE